VNTDIAHRLDVMAAAQADRDRAWLPHDRRGRWVVFEPGAGRHLSGGSRQMRRIVDTATPRRGRRFSSLSQARAFARAVRGTVHRWRRTAPSGGVWQGQSPWRWALSCTEKF